MQVHTDPIAETERYIQNQSKYGLEDKIPSYNRYLRYIGRVHPVSRSSRILEIGTGTGWFPTLCKLNGFQCEGLEISPQLISYAMETGRKNGVIPDIRLGNIEDTDIGRSRYDVIVASSVFEHVEHWRSGLKKAYEALKPGGALFFESTNKFNIISGEYPMPFYSWMPDRMRYRFRQRIHGPDVMKLGIDFNQFRYPLLRSTFRSLGFRKVLDVVDLAEPDRLSTGRRAVLGLSRKNRLARKLVLTFYPATSFICVK